ncbi:MAG: hypothetical protein ACE5DX_03985 [Candidatus Dojkabacteria bacterium]
MGPDTPQIHFGSVIDVLKPDPTTGLSGHLAFVSTFLLSRGAHLALNGDIVVVSADTPTDMLRYMQDVTGAEISFAKAPTPEPLYTTQLLDSIHSASPNGHTLTPYHQSPNIGQWAQKNGIQMTHTPAEKLQTLMPMIDNKAHFRRVAKKLGMPVMDQVTVSFQDEDSTSKSMQAISRMILENGGVYIQSSNSGGGLGNLDLRYSAETKTWYSTTFGQDDKPATYTDFKDVADEVGHWLVEAEKLGSTEVLIAPFIAELIESPTVSAYIPPLGHGDPVIYGYFDQIVNPETRAYQGFRWPISETASGVNPNYLYRESMKWFRYIQQQGYIGNADVDYAIGKVYQHGEPITITASESNVRMDAFRLPLQHAYRVAGGVIDPRNLADLPSLQVPHIKAFDHVHTSASTITELIQALTAAGIPIIGQNRSAGFNPSRGIVAIASPLGGEVALAMIGESPEDTNTTLEAAIAAVS